MKGKSQMRNRNRPVFTLWRLAGFVMAIGLLVLPVMAWAANISRKMKRPKG